MKVKGIEIAKEVMAGDVSPVAMFEKKGTQGHQISYSCLSFFSMMIIIKSYDEHYFVIMIIIMLSYDDDVNFVES